VLRLRRVVVSGGDLVRRRRRLVTVRDVALHPRPAELAGDKRSAVTGAGPYQLSGGWPASAPTSACPRSPSSEWSRSAARRGCPAARWRRRRSSWARRRGGAWRVSAEVDDRGAPRHVELVLRREAGATALTITGDRVPLAALAPLVPAGVGVERAHATGTVTAARGLATVISADVALDGAWIDHAAIADAPVPLAAPSPRRRLGRA
jgi:hypothetical protein